jgi:hypothetical protein
VDQQAARRRPLLKAALGGAVAVGAVGGAVRWWPGDDGADPRPALMLSAEGSGQVGEAVVDLDTPQLSRAAASGWWQSGQLGASTYSMVGLTWDDPAGVPVLEVRTRKGGSWGAWRSAPVLHDRPDRDSSEAASPGGTEPLWVGRCDGVQVRGEGVRPAGLRLVLLQPWELAVDREDAALAYRSAIETTALVPRPDMRGRARWGATESWRDGSPTYNRTIKQVHIHHTAGANGYTRSEVPAILRGIYRYHTAHMRWSDIGYNFLVDRFGRIWVGRAGGANRPVRGAHTLGFNETSTGISVIGNFETARPSTAVLDAIAAVAAWKLRRYDRDPQALIKVWSHGSDKYRAGRTVVLPVIDGHRNTNDTACPGDHLYEQIPEIRRRAARLIEYYSKVHVVERPTLTGELGIGRTLSVEGGSYAPAGAAVSYRWLRDGEPIRGADNAAYVVRAADAGSRLSVRVVARKDGLKAVRRTLWTPERLQVYSKVEVIPRPRGDGRLRVDVRVSSADGVPVPRGKVVVKVDGRRAVVRLEDGHGVAKFGWANPLDPGRYRVRARYLGDRAHDPDRASAVTRVRR